MKPFIKAPENPRGGALCFLKTVPQMSQPASERPAAACTVPVKSLSAL